MRSGGRSRILLQGYAICPQRSEALHDGKVEHNAIYILKLCCYSKLKEYSIKIWSHSQETSSTDALAERLENELCHSKTLAMNFDELPPDLNATRNGFYTS